MSTAIDTTESCASCGVPLAHDQRYCLNCGERRGNARLPFLDVLREQWEAERPPPPDTPPPPSEPPEPKRNWNALIAAAAGGGIALVLGVGFVIGQSGDSPPRAQRPQVIQVGGSGSTANASAATFTSDWADGQTGWTVQLQALPKDSTQPDAVASAKTAATGKGVKEVGALDSDATEGFDTGQYVVYSGVFSTEKDAKKRLSEVKGSFPDAKVVQVGGSASSSTSGGSSSSTDKASKTDLQNLQNSSPQDYQKKSRKLPDQVATPGTAPPKDNQAPGGGQGLQEIP